MSDQTEHTLRQSELLLADVAVILDGTLIDGTQAKSSTPGLHEVRYGWQTLRTATTSIVRNRGIGVSVKLEDGDARFARVAGYWNC